MSGKKRVKSTPKNPISEIFGTLETEESDEELLDTLQMLDGKKPLKNLPRRCGNCSSWGDDMTCSAPTPDSVRILEKRAMRPEEGSDCPVYSSKT